MTVNNYQNQRVHSYKLRFTYFKNTAKRQPVLKVLPDSVYQWLTHFDDIKKEYLEAITGGALFKIHTNHLPQSLFVNKETLLQVFSCEFCEILRTPPGEVVEMFLSN